MLVYVGAVMVLFLFVVMMLDINVDALARRASGSTCRWPALVGARDRARDGAGADARGFDLRRARRAPSAAAPKLSNTKLLGIALYTEYLYPLEIAAVILLVAIIAAIALTLRRRKDTQAHRPVRAGQGEEGATACASCR